MRILLAAAGLALAGLLLWLSATTHLQRACVVMDTPYLPLCPETPVPDEERRQDLRARLAGNPGDSSAWIELTNKESGPREQALFRAAAALAPNDPDVLRWRAGKALEKREWTEATDLLVQIVRYHGGADAPRVLARMVASGGEGTDLLRPHLETAARWLPPVLASLVAQKLPSSAALTLVAEAAALGAVPPQTLRSYTRSLKAEGRWADAYGLWLTLQRRPVSLLFNGGFDQRFQPDGFDWEVTPVPPGRAGAVVTQRGYGKRGWVLEVQFTSRPVAIPVIRQHMFMPPGKYVVKGEYMASRLRMEQGLAWSVRCSEGKTANTPAGRSQGLRDTAGAWKSFEFEVTIPPDCGLFARLQLETLAPVEAAAGFRGQASFDGFELRAHSM